MNTHALKQGEKVAKSALMRLVILGLIKTFAGVMTGMTVIIADAISTFADTLGVFASYFGLRMSRKSANKKFEYGYYKIETFAALVISLGTLYAGYQILQKSIVTFKASVEGHHRPFAVTATIVAIIFSYRLYKKLKIAGENANSMSLIANAQDKKMDIFSGFAVLISIFANYKQIPYIESIVTIVIALVILKTGLKSAKDSLYFLLDYWDDPILSRKIRKLFRSEHVIVDKVTKLRLRRAGTFIFGEAFIEINPCTSIQDLREELDILKAKILDLDQYIKDFAIYTHITKKDEVMVAVPVKKGNSLSAKVASNLAETKGYIFCDIKGNKIKKFYYRGIKGAEKHPVELGNFLKKEKITILINSRLNSLTYYNLNRTNNILIYPHLEDAHTVEQTIKLLLIDS